MESGLLVWDGIMERAIRRLEDDEMTEGEAKTWCIEQLPALAD